MLFQHEINIIKYIFSIQKYIEFETRFLLRFGLPIMDTWSSSYDHFFARWSSISGASPKIEKVVLNLEFSLPYFLLCFNFNPWLIMDINVWDDLILGQVYHALNLRIYLLTLLLHLVPSLVVLYVPTLRVLGVHFELRRACWIPH